MIHNSFIQLFAYLLRFLFVVILFSSFLLVPLLTPPLLDADLLAAASLGWISLKTHAINVLHLLEISAVVLDKKKKSNRNNGLRRIASLILSYRSGLSRPNLYIWTIKNLSSSSVNVLLLVWAGGYFNTSSWSGYL